MNVFAVLFYGISLCLFPLTACVAQSRAVNLVEVLYSTAYDGRATPEQAVVTFRHAMPFSKGDNLLFVDMSNIGNLENAGSTYIEWGPRLSIGRLAGKQPIRFGLIKDVYLVGELNHINNRNIANTTVLGGISVDLALPGFNFFKLHMEKRDDPKLAGNTEQLSMIWNYPFRLGSQNISFEGFLDYVGSEAGSRPSVHTQPQLMWKPHSKINLGLEYQYWYNKNGRKDFTESVMQGVVRWNF